MGGPGCCLCFSHDLDTKHFDLRLGTYWPSYGSYLADYFQYADCFVGSHARAQVAFVKSSNSELLSNLSTSDSY